MVFKMLHLGKITTITLSTIVSHIKPVQQYGRLQLVTVEMEKLYTWTMDTGLNHGLDFGLHIVSL